MKVIESKKEFIKFCKENNIKCTKNKDGLIKDSLLLELPADLCCVGEFANSMGIHYKVKEVDNKVIIIGHECPYKSGISYGTAYTFDNSDNQVLAVFGLWGGWRALVKSKDNERDDLYLIEKILPWIFYGE